METSESIKEIASALCKFQGSVEKIRKTENNPFFKSKYADLSTILDAIREPMTENGLSFVQCPTGEDELTTILMHLSGEWIKSNYTMKPVKNDPQGRGSAITYQRRYALSAILGLNIDEDDDGNAASKLATLKQALAELESCQNKEQAVKVWNKYPEYQKENEFIEAAKSKNK